MTLFAQPTVDAAALEALRQKQMAMHDAASKRMMQAMLDVAQVLTPEQRKKADELKADVSSLKKAVVSGEAVEFGRTDPLEGRLDHHVLRLVVDSAGAQRRRAGLSPRSAHPALSSRARCADRSA